jgi:serine/threonine-protein kinase RsbW
MQATQLPWVSLDMPASYKLLKILGPIISALLEDEEPAREEDTLVFQIELAVHEVCTNIIEHAFGKSGGRIQIDFSILEHPLRFVVDLHDTGKPYEYRGYKEPDIAEPQERGYGLFLIHQLTSSISYQSTSGINHWHLEKNL